MIGYSFEKMKWEGGEPLPNKLGETRITKRRIGFDGGGFCTSPTPRESLFFLFSQGKYVVKCSKFKIGGSIRKVTTDVGRVPLNILFSSSCTNLTGYVDMKKIMMGWVVDCAEHTFLPYLEKEIPKDDLHKKVLSAARSYLTKPTIKNRDILKKSKELLHDRYFYDLSNNGVRQVSFMIETIAYLVSHRVAKPYFCDSIILITKEVIKQIAPNDCEKEVKRMDGRLIELMEEEFNKV